MRLIAEKGCILLLAPEFSKKTLFWPNTLVTSRLVPPHTHQRGPSTRTQVPKMAESALRLFERYRVTNGHTIESFFGQLCPRKTKTVPVREFAANMSLYCDGISIQKALELSFCFDAERKSGEIGVRDIRRVLKRHCHLVTVQGLLEDSAVFPRTLAQREDFQIYYSEWGAENGVPALCLVEAALRLSGDERKPGDLQIIYKWLKLQKILVHVRQNRLLEVCRSIHLFDCPAGTHVVTQGDPGDAFYIVLSGSLDIIINGVVVTSIGAGTSFGEKALENNAPRAATVRAQGPCKLLVLMASEYQSLAATAQNRVLQDMVDFLFAKCHVLRSLSRAKIFTLVRAVTKQTLRPGEIVIRQGAAASALYVVMAGSVTLSRRVMTPPDQESKVLVETSTHHQHVPCVTIPIRDLAPGEVFGDDCLRAHGRNLHSYSATCSGSAACAIIMINRREVAEYFKTDALVALLGACQDLHCRDETLLETHATRSKQLRMMNELRESAFGPSYRDKTALSRLLQSQSGSVGGGKAGQQPPVCPGLPQSRALSTKALQAREQQHRGKLAQLEYVQRGASLATQRVGRRSSVLGTGALGPGGRRGSVAARRTSVMIPV